MSVERAAKKPPTSPWRGLYQQVRQATGARRDTHGAVGSINWLQHRMASRGANPNVVRNIIYRDKGRPPDKRALFAILDELWRGEGNPPLRCPQLEAALAHGSERESGVLRLLGGASRQAYRAFVQAVRADEHPKVAVVGQPGSGKVLLHDLLQLALEELQPPHDRLVRVTLGGTDVATALSRLGTTLGVPQSRMAARLVRVGTAGAFAVQADAQAEVAREILDAAKGFQGRQVLLLHLSRALAGQETLGQVPLRLNDPDVPRVPAAEWLWVSLVEPLSRLPRTTMLVSLAELPLRARDRMGGIASVVRLNPPTLAEARRFVRARLPDAEATRVEEIVQLAGRSFEELRTFTLLVGVREHDDEAAAPREDAVAQLTALLERGEDALRHFLAVVAVLSVPESPEFGRDELDHLLGHRRDQGGHYAHAFLDAVPGRDDRLRCSSLELALALRARLARVDAATYRDLHWRAAQHLAAATHAAPHGEVANRYLALLLEARAWTAFTDWMRVHGVSHALVGRLWRLARSELPAGRDLERVAQQVATHYVQLGTYRHPDVREALTVLAAASSPSLRAWATLRRAEGFALGGHHDQAEALLATLPTTDQPRLAADAAIARAGVARWRGRRAEAARLVFDEAPRHLQTASPGIETDAVHVKAALWAGLLAKDRGDFDAALASFDALPRTRDLDAARVAFQRGDVFMRLGHFDRALQALDEAVGLASGSEALASERTRYLARRGTIHRRRGDLPAAEADFAAARSILDGAVGDPYGRQHAGGALELDFWRARLDDEAGLLLLAEGNFDQAVLTFDRALVRFGRYAAAHGVDASYRVLRSTLRLAIAYACRSLRQPFRRPFAVTAALDADTPDLRRARDLISQVLAHIDDDEAGWRVSALGRDALLTANLFVASGWESMALAERALTTSGYPYLRAQAHAHLAVGALRLRDPAAAESHVATASAALAASTSGIEDEHGDLELAAWLASLATCAAIARGDALTAGRRLADGLGQRELRKQHVTLLRQFGDAASARGLTDWARAPELLARLQLAEPLETGVLRLPDALVAHWTRLGHDGDESDGARVAGVGQRSRSTATATEVTA